MFHYVVLHHRAMPGQPLPRGGSDHFDWMFEAGGSLRTWATLSHPGFDCDASLSADRLADHRREYLHYEGAISNDRGTVHQVERGQFQVMFESPDCWVLSVGGDRLATLTFQRTRAEGDGTDWQLSVRRERTEAS